MDNNMSFDDYMRWRGWAEGSLPEDIVERFRKDSGSPKDDFCDNCQGCPLELSRTGTDSDCWLVRVASCLSQFPVPDPEQIREACRTVLWALGAEVK